MLDKKFLYDDIDNDGDEDIIGLISFSGTGHPTTNFTRLVVFLNKIGNAEFAMDKDTDAIYASLTTVKGNKIYVTTDNYSDDDPQCCPSIRRNYTYEFKDNTLEKVK